MSGLVLVPLLVFAAACGDQITSVDDAAVSSRADASTVTGIGLLAAFIDPVGNGDFEAGLTSWTPSPATNWIIATANGGNVAQSTFDSGFLPASATTLSLSQDVPIDGACLELAWDDHLDGVPLSLDPTLVPQAYLEINGARLTPSLAFTGPWQSHTASLSAYPNSTVTLSFSQLIPEGYMGTMLYEVDNVVVRPSAGGGGTSTVTAKLDPVDGKSLKSDKGTFMVVATCGEGGCGPGAAATATLNGVPVENGQIVQLEVKSKKSKSDKSNNRKSLKLKDTSFILEVDCDGATATAEPVFADKSQKSKKDKKSKKG
jgi:hypothetical protein